MGTKSVGKTSQIFPRSDRRKRKETSPHGDAEISSDPTSRAPFRPRSRSPARTSARLQSPGQTPTRTSPTWDSTTRYGLFREGQENLRASTTSSVWFFHPHPHRRADANISSAAIDGRTVATWGGVTYRTVLVESRVFASREVEGEQRVRALTCVRVGQTLAEEKALDDSSIARSATGGKRRGYGRVGWWRRIASDRTPQPLPRGECTRVRVVAPRTEELGRGGVEGKKKGKTRTHEGYEEPIRGRSTRTRRTRRQRYVTGVRYEDEVDFFWGGGSSGGGGVCVCVWWGEWGVGVTGW